jgi:hypothetical protein
MEKMDAIKLGPRTTRTISQDKSVAKRGLVGPYVKTTRTVLLFYNIVQYLYVYNHLFIYLKGNYYLLVKMNYLLNDNITCDQKCD